MREFYFNEEIYEDIKSDENLVICARLGSGKSESVKKYLSETNKDKILLVVNDGNAQGSYWSDLEDKIIIHNKLQDEVVIGIKIINWDDIAIRDYDEAYDSLTDDVNVLCITKSKFNKLLSIRPNSLMTFHKIIIDESNGLNPIMVTDLTTDIDKIINNLSPIMKIKSNLYFNSIVDILTFLKKIQNKYCEEEIVLFYQEDISTELQQVALNLIRNMRRLYNEKKLVGLNDVDLLFGVLNSMANNSFYLGDIMMKGKKQVHILFANTFLSDYINSTNSIIKILDGTADNIKPLYDWLKVKVKKEYVCNEKTYPNLKIHVHTYKNLTPAKGRKSLEHTRKVVEDILNSKRNGELTFSINGLVKDNIFTENFDLLEYAFNGRDIGSNEFRDMTEMNIIYYQTLPRTYRMVYNKLFKDLTFEESCSHKYMKEAESELVGAMLCQLIGRLKIRSDNNSEVNVHCYCVSRDSLQGTVEHFGLKKDNVVKYDEVDIGIDLYNIKEDEIVEKLKEYIESDHPDKIILVDWIRLNFYDEKAKQETINSMYKNSKVKIQNEIKNYSLITKRGRGFKAYLELNS